MSYIFQFTLFFSKLVWAVTYVLLGQNSSLKNLLGRFFLFILCESGQPKQHFVQTGTICDPGSQYDHLLLKPLCCSQDCIAHVTLHTAHYILHTIHCTLYITHSILHNIHCTLSTAHYTPHTIHYTYYTAYYTPHTIQCTLYTGRFSKNGGRGDKRPHKKTAHNFCCQM